MVIKLEKPLSTAMNARVIGSGKETVVLAHGYGGDQSVWDKVLPALTQTYQVLVFDWCFSGTIKDPNTLFDPAKYASYEAFSDDLIALFDELNLDSTVFVGHSMSAMIGCIASIKKPHLFKNLILVCPSPRRGGVLGGMRHADCIPPSTPCSLITLFELSGKIECLTKCTRYINSESYEGGFDIASIEQLFSSMESNYDQWSSFFPSLVIDKNDSEAVNVFEKTLKRIKPEIGLSIAKTVFLSDHRDILEKVAIPCTIIQTTNDVVVPLSVVEYMKKMIKGKTTIEMIDTIGHFPQLTAPTQFLEIFDRVLSICDS